MNLKKTFALLMMLVLSTISQSFAQSSSYNVDPTTKLITNLKITCSFSQFYKYDFDLHKAVSPSAYSESTVIIEISAAYPGRLVLFASGKKAVHAIVTCRKDEFGFVINSYNDYGDLLVSHLSIKNNSIDMFWIETKNNTSTVFSN